MLNWNVTKLKKASSGLNLPSARNISQPAGSFCDINLRDVAVLGVLVAAAFAMRLYFLPFLDVISVDGTTYVNLARAMRQGDFSGVGSYGFYPVLIWLAGFFFQDLETAGRMVSLVFGSLLCVPVYLLGIDMFSRRTAYASCVVMLAWPILRHFSCEVMTQSSYMTLALTGVYLVWRMMRTSSVVSALLAGLFLGIAYVTRTEAILIFAAAPLPLLYAYRREFKSRITVLAAYAVAALIVIGANLILVHHATGSWQLASKTSVALIDAISYIRNIPDMNYIPDVEPVGYLQILRDYPSFIYQNIHKNVQFLLTGFIPAPFWVLLVAGIAAGGMRSDRNLVRTFLLTTYAPLGVIIVYYYTAPEYNQVYIPVTLLYCAEGLRVIENRIVPMFVTFTGVRPTMRWLTYNPAMLAAATLYAVISFAGVIPDRAAEKPYQPEHDDGRRDQKHLGLVLKENLPPGKIMTRWARIAFYAEREWASIPNTDYDGIMDAARQDGVKFLIVTGGLLPLRPGLGYDLFEVFNPGVFENGIFFGTDRSSISKPGLRPYMVYINNPASVGMVVYELL